MSALSKGEFLSGLSMLAATLARYRMQPEEQAALGEAWLRAVYPHVRSKEHWDKTLDVLLTHEGNFPQPGAVIADLDRLAWSMHGGHQPSSRGPVWPGGEWQYEAVTEWVRQNPRKTGEGVFEYIDRIAFENKLIPERLIGTSDAVKGLEGTAGILGRLRGDQAAEVIE